MADARGARIARLINDPDLSGDVLLVGLILAATYDLDGVAAANVRDIAQVAWPNKPLRDAYWRTKEAFRKDIRTYKPPSLMGAACQAPMVRRDGPCGRTPSLWGYVRDWTTGELSVVASCSRHPAWGNAQFRANWDAKPDVVPLPVANSGGVLAGHFPELMWREFWRELDPLWVEHPEAKPWPKPTFSLLLGGGDSTDSNRPLLAIAGSPA